MNFAYKNNFLYIGLLYTFYLFFFSKGTIAGDYERIYNITSTFLESGKSYFDFINGSDLNKINQSINESSFFKHNFVFFLIFVIVLKIIAFFSFVATSVYFEEFILASIPGSLFFFSIILLFKTYKTKFNRNLIIISIILFFFGTYLINFFASSAYAESLIFFLLSLRMYIENKKNNSIFLPIIDFLLIKVRITAIFVMPYFLFNFFSKKINKYFILKYSIPFIILFLISEKVFPSSQLSSRYYDNIFAAFCFQDLNGLFLNIYEYLSLYFERVYLTFFSFNLGIFFIFPCSIVIVISFFYKFTTGDFLKILSFFSIVFVLALEEYWFLPAGISGNRGLAPFLLLFYTNYILGIKIFINYFKNKSFHIILLFILIFVPTIFYRTTIGVYAMCGSIENCSNSIRNSIIDRPILKLTDGRNLMCRAKNNFPMFKFEMFPSIYSIRIIYNKFFNIKTTPIYYDNNEILLSDTEHLVPETIGSKFLFLVNSKSLKLVNKNKDKLQKIVQKYKLILNFIVNLVNITFLIILIFILRVSIKNYLKN